jgi:hypothetical protein
MPAFGHDEIVDTRTWKSGTEIVSHVNWSHVARVRRALGIAGDEFGRTQFEQRPLGARPTLRVAVGWRAAHPRAA